jgi:hypothetical protein
LKGVQIMPTVDFTKDELISDLRSSLLPEIAKQTDKIVLGHFMSFIEHYFNPALERITNLESNVAKMGTNIEKMDKRLASVEKQTKDIKPTLRKHAADIDELQVARGLR